MNKIIFILEKVLNQDLQNYKVEDINPDNISSWDSLSHLQIIASLEDEFNIDIAPEDIVKMNAGLSIIIGILKRYGIDID